MSCCQRVFVNMVTDTTHWAFNLAHLQMCLQGVDFGKETGTKHHRMDCSLNVPRTSTQQWLFRCLLLRSAHAL